MLFRSVGGDGNFHTIAGGEDHAFNHAGTRAKVIERFGKRLLLKSQAFAHLDGRGVVAQACEEKLHMRLGNEDRPQSGVCDPRECAAAENDQRHHGGFSAAPAR